MTGDEVHVLARVMLRHPDLTVDDVVYARMAQCGAVRTSFWK